MLLAMTWLSDIFYELNGTLSSYMEKEGFSRIFCVFTFYPRTLYNLFTQILYFAV